MNAALLSSKNMCWCTPQDFFDKLNAEFGFVLDPGGDRQDGEMLFVLHTGNGRAFAKLGSRRRGILQSALRTRDRQVGSKGFRGSAGGGVSDCFTYPSADGHGIFSRLHLRKAEIRFVRGRLRFTDDDGNAADPAPFPSMVVIYNGERVKNE